MLSTLKNLRRRNGSTYFTSWTATDEGVLFECGTAVEGAIGGTLSSTESTALLEQLVDDDYAELHGEAVRVSWALLYDLLRAKPYQSSISLLDLPTVSTVVPSLRSAGTLTDPHFEIGLSGWWNEDGSAANLSAMKGATLCINGQPALISEAVWKLLDLVSDFASRGAADRTPESNRKRWGQIRRAALEADAILDDFLVRSVVVTPEKLDIEFRKTGVGGTAVVEIMPGFEGAPERWLEYFDNSASVPTSINIPTRDGVVHVAFSDSVRSVLREIKKLPGRRAAGARAEAFLLNPFSALGEDAIDVIDEAQFEVAKEKAGVHFERFRPHLRMDAAGYPYEIGIDIEDTGAETQRRIFATDDELEAFVTGLATRLTQQLQLFAWKEFEFELSGESQEHHGILASALAMRRKPSVLIDRNRVFDLSSYSERVSGIGEEEPFISPYIVKKTDEDSWFPTNLLVLLKVGAEDATFPLDPADLSGVDEKIAQAKSDGAENVCLDGCSVPLPVGDLENALKAVRSALENPPPNSQEISDAVETKQKRSPSLLLKGNINALEHDESRRILPPTSEATMECPRSLKADVKLRDHQVAGIARMQQLFSASPNHCRGVLLADDMGLGKTLQLLTFLASAFEKYPELPPAMIVAPVSLLENWQKEIEKYFLPEGLSVVTAYGEALSSLRVPRAAVAAELQAEGLVRFLRPNWRGNAQIVLTTYETLRDLEFSFALEPWSILVCDEAQKIKNPNARVTRAAKKLNVRFRVACTGTPVENSLTDIWCLFDLIQPGLLGPLNEFGRSFGRIIETRGSEAKTKADELRAQIEPQVIRRTKADVAKDLPRKIEVPDCHVEFSNEQRALYVGALQLFHQTSASEDDDAKLHHLGLLQYLRLVCADPRRYGVETFVPEDPAAYRRKAPKMDWLLSTLERIRHQGEKVLIFAEHRDVQRMLQHYINAVMDVKPQIVNGDTAVSSKAEQSRQKILDRFQAEPGFGVIILSPLAVGFGVNIQEANHVVHYLRHWNPAKEDQATDRAYRIGQKRDVYVYCPLTTAKDFKSFDVKMDELLRTKRSLAGDMLTGAGSLADIEFDIREIVPDVDRTLRNDPITMDVIERANPAFFEAFVAALWKKKGYDTRLTPPSDAGVDVVAIRGSGGCLIQCKSSMTVGRGLGWDAVKEVVGGTAIYSEQFPTVQFTRICITNQCFNPRARDRARANGVELYENEALKALLDEFPIGMLDVLSVAGRTRA